MKTDRIGWKNEVFWGNVLSLKWVICYAVSTSPDLFFLLRGRSYRLSGGSAIVGLILGVDIIYIGDTFRCALFENQQNKK